MNTNPRGTIYSITLITLLGLTQAALAQAPPPPDEIRRKPVAVPLGAADLRRGEDAAVDRNIIGSSAETIGEGQWTFNSYELFLAGITYGITDDIQASVTTFLPIIADSGIIVLTNVKWRMYADDHLIFSMQPSLSLLTHNDIDGMGGLVGVGFLLDYIVDDEGAFVLSFSDQNAFAWGKYKDSFAVSEGFAFALAASVTFRASHTLKLIAEFTLPGLYTKGKFDVDRDTVLFTYGVRFFGPSVSVDLAFIRPVGTLDFLAMGIPLVTFAARW